MTTTVLVLAIYRVSVPPIRMEASVLISSTIMTPLPQYLMQNSLMQLPYKLVNFIICIRIIAPPSLVMVL